MSTPVLNTAQLERAVGVLLGTAAGDALGGGTFDWAPGEWTADTSLAWVIATEAGTGTELRTPHTLDAIAHVLPRASPNQAFLAVLHATDAVGHRVSNQLLITFG